METRDGTRRVTDTLYDFTTENHEKWKGILKALQRHLVYCEVEVREGAKVKALSGFWSNADTAKTKEELRFEIRLDRAFFETAGAMADREFVERPSMDKGALRLRFNFLIATTLCHQIAHVVGAYIDWCRGIKKQEEPYWFGYKWRELGAVWEHVQLGGAIFSISGHFDASEGLCKCIFDNVSGTGWTGIYASVPMDYIYSLHDDYVYPRKDFEEASYNHNFAHKNPLKSFVENAKAYWSFEVEGEPVRELSFPLIPRACSFWQTTRADNQEIYWARAASLMMFIKIMIWTFCLVSFLRQLFS